jgi:hypothetical protein
MLFWLRPGCPLGLATRHNGPAPSIMVTVRLTSARGLVQHTNFRCRGRRETGCVTMALLGVGRCMLFASFVTLAWGWPSAREPGTTRLSARTCSTAPHCGACNHHRLGERSLSMRAAVHPYCVQASRRAVPLADPRQDRFRPETAAAGMVMQPSTPAFRSNAKSFPISKLPEPVLITV